MNFVITGVVLLLVFVLGVTAYISVPYYEKENIENEIAPVVAFSAFFTKKNLRRILFLCLVSGGIASIAGVSYSAGTDAFDLSRRIVVAISLFVAMIVDIKTRLIPNVVVTIALGLGVLLLLIEFIFSRESFTESLVSGGVGIICCFVLFYVFSRITKDGIGMGDVKLISVMGFLLGLSTTLISVLCSLLICTTMSIVLLCGKKKNKNDSIPFGPFLFLGYILVYLLLSI